MTGGLRRSRNTKEGEDPKPRVQETGGESIARPVSATKTEQARIIAERQWEEQGGDSPVRDVADVEKLPLSYIRLDPDNVRTRHITLADPTTNSLAPDHADYLSNQLLIDGLIEFAEKLKTNPILQMPAVYKASGKYYTAYGARRFLSLLIAFGPNAAAEFKVYGRKPQNLASVRFAENNQREDLPLSGKVLEFENAFKEASGRIVSRGDKLTNEAVAQEVQKSAPLIAVYRYAIDTPVLYAMIADGRVSSYADIQAIRKAKAKTETQIIDVLNAKGGETPKAKPQPQKRAGGRPKTSISFPKVQDVSVMRRVINGDLANFEWKESDFESFEALSEKLAHCIKALKDGT